MGLTTAVALDRDGVVADLYDARSIPQTVVIDQNGNVARVYVGGGPEMAAELRDALRRLLSESDAQSNGAEQAGQ
jgi:hypothetical protein